MLSAGAIPLRPRRLQRDVLLDSPDGSLKARGCALRIRADGHTTVLTFKGAVHAGPMKARDEHETVVDDADALTRILNGLNLRQWFCYEKYREEFSAPGVVIAIDETPIGTFVEIEGDEPGIRNMALALGRDERHFVRASYRSLFLETQATLDPPGTDMLFPTS